MNELALFAGAGGGILGGKLLGWSTVCACELDPYPRNVLLARQRDGILPPFPIWDDVTTFDGKPWRGLVDIITGGFPCQDISCAGKGAGISGSRSGLWSHMHRIICEVRPPLALMENSPLLTSRGLDTVLGDLAESGYHATWTCLSAGACGAPHLRDRIWILAADSLPNPNMSRIGWRLAQQSQTPQARHAESEVWNTYSDNETTLAEVSRGEQTAEPGRSSSTRDISHPHSPLCKGADSSSVQPRSQDSRIRDSRSFRATRSCWETEPDVGRVADGVASRVDRLKAIGNGQVPLVAATAFNHMLSTLTPYLNNHQ